MDARRLERLLELGPAFSERLDLEHVLHGVLDHARELTGARYAALGVIDPSGGELERFITVGLSDDERAAIGDLPRGHGVLGELIRNPRPLRLADIGAHPRSYGFPAGHPPMTTFLGAPIRVGDSVYGNLYLTDKAGGEEFDEDDEAVLVLVARWAGAAIQNARAHDLLERRHRDLQRRVRLLETTEEITRALGAETELDRVLELVVKRARALVEARGVILVVERAGDLIVTNVSGDLDLGLVGTALPRESSLAARAVAAGRPLRVDNVPSEVSEPLRAKLNSRAGLVIPLLFRGTHFGAIEAFDRLTDGPGFSDEDEGLLSAFAASASIAIATAQSAAAESLRRSIDASESERKRWARELHDETLQQIGALRVILHSALQTGDAERMRSAMGQAVDELAHASSSLRELITDLRPAALDELGVRAALEALVQRARSRTDAEISLFADMAFERGDQETRLLPVIENTLYRVAQEALNNALAHASASRVQINLVEDSTAVDLLVRDDGRGFDTEADHPGFGLAGIFERVGEAGGQVTVNSGKGGTTVEVILPAERAPAPLRPAPPAPGESKPVPTR